mmetsp:Transcript_7029/g.10680  ORF Transcript_7029/g.10680 Transcript_7029/m.10680 type:complete len:398 (+) Transcript_7029:383-1576(+)
MCGILPSVRSKPAEGGVRPGDEPDGDPHVLVVRIPPGDPRAPPERLRRGVDAWPQIGHNETRLVQHGRVEPPPELPRGHPLRGLRTRRGGTDVHQRVEQRRPIGVHDRAVEEGPVVRQEVVRGHRGRDEVRQVGGGEAVPDELEVDEGHVPVPPGEQVRRLQIAVDDRLPRLIVWRDGSPRREGVRLRAGGRGDGLQASPEGVEVDVLQRGRARELVSEITEDSGPGVLHQRRELLLRLVVRLPMSAGRPDDVPRALVVRGAPPEKGVEFCEGSDRGQDVCPLQEVALTPALLRREVPHQEGETSPDRIVVVRFLDRRQSLGHSRRSRRLHQCPHCLRIQKGGLDRKRFHVTPQFGRLRRRLLTGGGQFRHDHPLVEHGRRTAAAGRPPLEEDTTAR